MKPISLPLPALPRRCTCEYFSICIVKYRYSPGIYSHPSSPSPSPPPIRLHNLRREPAVLLIKPNFDSSALLPAILPFPACRLRESGTWAKFLRDKHTVSHTSSHFNRPVLRARIVPSLCILLSVRQMNKHKKKQKLARLSQYVNLTDARHVINLQTKILVAYCTQ